jgi:polar amino acid transport system substrate-binding protein
MITHPFSRQNTPSCRIAYFLVVVLLLALSSCAPEQSPPTSTLSPRLQRIQDSGKLAVGVALTRPFEYRDPQTNDLIGFDVDLTGHIAAGLEVGIEWREMAFADLLNQLAAGNVDMVIAAMYITPAREELIDFSIPYLDTGLVMVVQTDNNSITDFASLAGKTVGVKEGATGERWADNLRAEEGISFTILRYEETIDSLNDLDAGLLDVVFNDQLNTLEYTKTHPGVRIQGEVFDPAGLGIAVQSGDVELLAYINEVVLRLQESGEMDILYTRWIDPSTGQ